MCSCMRSYMRVWVYNPPPPPPPALPHCRAQASVHICIHALTFGTASLWLWIVHSPTCAHSTEYPRFCAPDQGGGRTSAQRLELRASGSDRMAIEPDLASFAQAAPTRAVVNRHTSLVLLSHTDRGGIAGRLIGDLNVALRAHVGVESAPNVCCTHMRTPALPAAHTPGVLVRTSP